MRLKKARIQKYRSIRDTGYFDIEPGKTILVGPNEAGKTALLEALQRINPPGGIRNFDALRDYPRSEFNDIVAGKIQFQDTTTVEGHFSLDPEDKEAISEEFRESDYVFGRRVDNSAWHMLTGGPSSTTYGDLKKEFSRLCAHVDAQRQARPDFAASVPSLLLSAITQNWPDTEEIKGHRALELRAWLDKIFPLVEEGNEVEEKRYDAIMTAVGLEERRYDALKILNQRLPVFIRFRDYFRVRPLVHLEHLAHRLETNVLDGDYYDYGNQCLLRSSVSPRANSRI